MILHAAIGDAYGAGFEFAPADLIASENLLTTYRPHLIYPEICGRYTDDTQMALAICELILSGDEWTPERIADSFVQTFKRDPRRGYSSRLYEILMQVNSGKELVASIRNNSDRNGAAMRAFPIGLYPDVEEVLEKADMQARITHDTEVARTSAKAVALMAHGLYHGKAAPEELGTFVESHLPGDWSQNWNTEVTMLATDAVLAALTLIRTCSSLSEMLQKGIAFGGDVDTVGAITLGCASLSPEIKMDLPDWMNSNLENGAFGQDYLVSIDMQLFSKYPRLRA